MNRQTVERKQSSSSRAAENNLDFLRLIFAFTVLFAHSYDLTENVKLEFLKQFFNSEVAVNAFFVISGFLIFRSFEMSMSIGDYVSKRIRRIYPAYFVTVLCGGVLGMFITDLTVKEYLLNKDLVKYLVSNFAFLNFLQPALPGVFNGNKIDAVNGVLWTIRTEVTFYAITPLIAIGLRRFNKAFVLFVLYLLSIISFLLLDKLGHATNNHLINLFAFGFPWQLSFYLGGGFFIITSARSRENPFSFLSSQPVFMPPVRTYRFLFY